MKIEELIIDVTHIETIQAMRDFVTDCFKHKAIMGTLLISEELANIYLANIRTEVKSLLLWYYHEKKYNKAEFDGITMIWEIEEKKECEIIFGFDIKTDTELPKGTVAFGYYKGDNQIVITNLKKIPEEKKTLSDEIIYYVHDKGFTTKEAFDESNYAGNGIMLREEKVKEAIKDIKEDIIDMKYTLSEDEEAEVMEIINKRVGERLT